MNIKARLARFREHLTAIDGAVFYPDINFPQAPRGIDMRGPVEMDAYWQYCIKLLAKREELEKRK